MQLSIRNQEIPELVTQHPSAPNKQSIMQKHHSFKLIRNLNVHDNGKYDIHVYNGDKKKQQICTR
jgi:hypothetical protein